jgi:membrane protease YdiL (CAAX protease family)
MPWDVWLIFFVLGVVVPWRGRMRLRELLAKPHVGSRERISLYASTIAFQWTAAALAGWRAWAHGFTASQLGLVIHPGWKVVAAGVLGAGILATLHWLNLRRMGRITTKAHGMLQALAERILPQSPGEILPFLALAVTAGICEEFLYRGFALAAFTRAGLPVWIVVLLSSALFGLAHLYQGRGGLVGTMILGMLFGVARIAYDSVVPVMVWHVAVDVVAGVAGPRYLTRTTAAAGLGLEF